MRKERDCQTVTKRADEYEVLRYVVLKGDVCVACGAELTLALAAVLVVGEHAVAHCERCGKEQEVRETARVSALLVFVACLLSGMATPQNEDIVDQVTAARFLLLALAVVRLAFAHVGEELRAHGGTALKNDLSKTQTVLTSVAESLDEPSCRRTLLLFGDAPEPFLAHYTRATLAFSAYQRYTRGVVEGVPVTTARDPSARASKQPDPELAQVYDELCAESYLELRDAVCALCLAFLSPPPHALLAQDG